MNDAKLTKYADKGKADQAVDWILTRTAVVPAAAEQFLRARGLPVADFEDAVVAALAESARCDYVISRNVAGFNDSPVPALTPEEFLVRIGRT